VTKSFHRWSLTFHPALPAREIAVAYLDQAGFTMFEPEGNSLVAHGVQGEVDIELGMALVEEIRAFSEVSLQQEVVAEENWNAQWEGDYPLVEVLAPDGRLACTVRAPFHESPSVGLDVVIAPQMSFGTGHHATTYMMIAAMLPLVRMPRSVLDMGCGTGVLAVVAALCGSARVVGIDIEAAAVDNSTENARLNGLGDALATGTLAFSCGDGTALAGFEDGLFDLVLANIHKNVLAADMPSYSRLLCDGGDLLLSGFFEGDVSGLTATAVAHGLNVREVHVREGWACIHCGKPSRKL